MKRLKPELVKSVERHTDPLGTYWQVFYRWEFGGRKFSYGSPPMYEDLTPEEKYIGEISDLMKSVVDDMVKDQLTQVDIYTIADGYWMVKTIKETDNGLFSEEIRKFCDLDEAVAYVKNVKRH